MLITIRKLVGRAYKCGPNNALNDELVNDVIENFRYAPNPDF